MFRSLRFCVLSLSVIAGLVLPALTQSSGEVQKSPEQYLRKLFYRGDGSLIERDGESFATAKDASLETRAWFVQAPRGGQSFFTALSVLDGMTKDAPDSAWTLAARTYFALDTEQAIALCDRATGKDSREDILLYCTRAILQQVSKPDHAKLLDGFLTRHKEGFEKSALGLVAEGRAVNTIRWTVDHKQFSDDATALFDQALGKEPSSEIAIAAKYGDLSRRKQYKEAADLFERNASQIESESLNTNYVYSLVPNIPGLSKDDKAKRIEAAARKYVDRGEPGTDYVGRLNGKLRESSKQRAEALMDYIQQRYRNTRAARAAEFEQITKDLDENIDQTPSEKRKNIAVQLLEFLKRSLASKDDEAVQGVLRPLYEIATRNDLTSEQLFQIVNVAPESSPYLTQLVADRTVHLSEIESLAAAQVERATREAKTNSLLCARDLPESKAFNLKRTWMELATWEDTLGWIYLQQGRLNDAERKLTSAEAILDTPIGMGTPGKLIDDRTGLLVHLGRLYTEKGDYAKAESYLARAIGIESFETEHPAIAAYKNFYLKQHGSEEGLEKFMAASTEKDRERRKAKILGERIADAKPIPPFKLTRLGGKTVSSDELKGKIAVINFWGTWCGPCKFELPEIQKFADKYKDNPNVVFLAIDTKDSPDQVKTFLAEKKYSFPVLMEGDYLETANVQAFPTTWFIDRDGKKVFEKVGSSKRVVEEFTWRVEGMMEVVANDSKQSEIKTP